MSTLYTKTTQRNGVECTASIVDYVLADHGAADAGTTHVVEYLRVDNGLREDITYFQGEPADIDA